MDGTRMDVNVVWAVGYVDLLVSEKYLTNFNL
jgi:hypothetical protein